MTAVEPGPGDALTDDEREALLFGFGFQFRVPEDHDRFARGVAAVEAILAARQQQADTQQAAGRINTMLSPLRAWLTHAGYGVARLNAARKALDDFQSALASERPHRLPGDASVRAGMEDTPDDLTAVSEGAVPGTNATRIPAEWPVRQPTSALSIALIARVLGNHPAPDPAKGCVGCDWKPDDTAAVGAKHRQHQAERIEHALNAAFTQADTQQQAAADRAAVERVAALANGWVGFDDSHHYGDAVLLAIGPDALAREPHPGDTQQAAADRFTADEVIEIANETSDSFGNLYRLDFIDRIRHEAALAREPHPGDTAVDDLPHGDDWFKATLGDNDGERGRA